MKHHIKYFISGMLATLILSSTLTPALANSITKTIEVVMNSVNIKLNGIDVCSAGIDYSLPNGSTVPNSITYTDENGGDTTYLPLRKISELLGFTVDYDSGTRTAILTSNPDNTAAPQTDTIVTDDNSSSTEDEAAYQDFKSMWSINYLRTTNMDEKLFNADYNGQLSQKDFLEMWKEYSSSTKIRYANRLAQEHQLLYSDYIIALYFRYSGTELGYAFCYENNHALSSFVKSPFAAS
jgi:hypothetical protein